MRITSQILTSLSAPLQIRRGSSAFFVGLIAYICLGLLIFGGVGYSLNENQDSLRQLLMDYFLPQSWHWAADKLMDFFLASQTKVVLVSMIISGALVVASVLLFPLKEYCSAQFERDLRESDTTPAEFPLWRQAMEEGKLLLLYLTAQSIIFAIGYYPYAWCDWLSSALSLLFLFFSFGLDLIAPTLQRHRLAYAPVIKLLLRNSALTLAFGLIFSLPMLLLGNWIIHHEVLTLVEISVILFLFNMLFLTLAIPAGTAAASALLTEAHHLQPPGRTALRLSYGVLTTAFLLSSGLHALVAISLHHKSQLLKCDYDIEWKSLDIRLPSLGELARGETQTEIRFWMTIRNPTPFNLRVEDSVLLVKQYDRLISRTEISTFGVDSGESVRLPMAISSTLNNNRIAGWGKIASGWSIHLEIALLPGIPLILELLAAEPAAQQTQIHSTSDRLTAKTVFR